MGGDVEVWTMELRYFEWMWQPTTQSKSALEFLARNHILNCWQHFGLLNFLGVIIIITAQRVFLSPQILRWGVRMYVLAVPPRITSSIRRELFVLSRFSWINKSKSCLNWCFDFFELASDESPGTKTLPN